MPTYGLTLSHRAFTIADEAGLLLAEAHRSREALVAALDRVARRPDVRLVIDEESLHATQQLDVCILRVPLYIVPAEVLDAARALTRRSRRSTRQTASLLAQLPSVPWLATFLRSARPASDHQLDLI